MYLLIHYMIITLKIYSPPACYIYAPFIQAFRRDP